MKQPLTNQELLDRYIHSLKLMLPADKVEDIAAEIRSNLQSLIDDRSMELGRELHLDEVSAILKRHGHPVVVAARYRDQPARGLISPYLFPFYWFTLRAVFVVWLTIRLIVTIFLFQGTAPASSILLQLGRDVILAAFFIGGGITLIFAIWEYLEFKHRYSERWKPESLPPVLHPRTRQLRPAAAVLCGAVGLVFWAGALFLPGLSWVWGAWSWGGTDVMGPSQTVYAMRLPLWLLAFSVYAQSWLGYTRFAAASWRPFLRIAVNLTGIGLALFLLSAGDFLVKGPNWQPGMEKTLATLNQMVAGTLVVLCILAALMCLSDLRCLIRRPGSHDRTAQSAG
jgi:hypothetical protein